LEGKLWQQLYAKIIGIKGGTLHGESVLPTKAEFKNPKAKIFNIFVEVYIVFINYIYTQYS